MSATAGFITFLVTTVLLLGAVLWTGFRAQRKQHIPLVVLTLVSLGTAIYFAEQLGREYDLESAGVIKPVHLALAKIATASYLLPLVTGIRTIFVPKTRRVHRNVAFLVLALTVAALVTGTMMVMAATPLDAAALEGAGDATPGLPHSGQ